MRKLNQNLQKSECESYREPEARNGPTHGTALLNHPEPLLEVGGVRLQTVLMENCWTMKVPVQRFQSHRLTEREIYGCEVMKESAIIPGWNLITGSAMRFTNDSRLSFLFPLTNIVIITVWG